MELTAIHIVLLVVLVLSALGTVMTSNLLRAAIALAGTSSTLAILMYMLGAPYAAVFELSVCAGLIPAIFISAISLTRRLTPAGEEVRRRARIKTLWLLPVIVILVGVAMTQVKLSAADVKLSPTTPPAPATTTAPATAISPASQPASRPATVQEVLWKTRHVDLLGQVVILLGGAFGVVVLLKEIKRD